MIVGKPNAGKSSLLNRLSGEEAAIVTEVAGTTRDILREQINIAGLAVELVDTAGLRDADGRVEQLTGGGELGRGGAGGQLRRRRNLPRCQGFRRRGLA